MARAPENRIESFNFIPGRVLVGKYEVISRLGAGWEGEVFHVRELATGIERAIKFFYPHRNIKNRNVIFYAKKLHKLRHCPIVIQYHTQEVVTYRRTEVVCLVSEFVEGELLCDFIKRQPNKRLHYFQALHLLHSLAVGIETIHNSHDYHGDLHEENIVVNAYGVGFDVKLLDMYHWRAPSRESIRDDVVDLIHIFYKAIGGRRHYAKQPPQIKSICCGLKKSLILKKYRTAGQLREYLETIEW